jgi:hypothetical protein
MCVEFLTVVAGDRKIASFTRDSLLDGFFFFVRKEKKKGGLLVRFGIDE